MHCGHGLFFHNCTPRLSYKSTAIFLHGSIENDSNLLLPFRPPLLDMYRAHGPGVPHYLGKKLPREEKWATKGYKRRSCDMSQGL